MFSETEYPNLLDTLYEGHVLQYHTDHHLIKLPTAPNLMRDWKVSMAIGIDDPLKRESEWVVSWSTEECLLMWRCKKSFPRKTIKDYFIWKTLTFYLCCFTEVLDTVSIL